MAKHGLALCRHVFEESEGRLVPHVTMSSQG
jgi:hypothetical protein